MNEHVAIIDKHLPIKPNKTSLTARIVNTGRFLACFVNINPFKSNGISHSNQFDQSIFV